MSGGNKLTRLHVHADGLIISKSDTGDDQPVKLTLASAEQEISGGETVGQIDFKSGDDSVAGDGIVCASIQAEALGAFNGTDDPTKLSFLTRNSGASAERMVITPQGVGIGTTDVATSVNLAIGDSDTGLKQEGVGQLALIANGNEGIRVTDNGVGIKTQPSGSDLDLAIGDSVTGLSGSAAGLALRTGNQEQMRVTNNGVGIKTTSVAASVDLAIGDNDTGLKQQGDDELALVQDGNERMRVTNNGVGIKTTSVAASVDLAIGDNDTGLKQQGDNELALVQNGNEQMRVTNNGVGIKTTSVATSVDLAIGDSDTGLKQQGDNELALVQNGNEQMRVTNNGVGIKTTSVAASVDLAIGDSDTGLKQQGDGELALVQDGNERMRVTNNGVGIKTQVVHESVDLAIGVSDTGFKTETVVDQQHLAVITNTAERMRVTNNAVGIGVTDPKGKLHIYESTGTSIQPDVEDPNRSGTIILEHGDVGGESSILFKSKVNAGSDYGFIRYIDDGAANNASNENSLLEIGVQNDPDATNNDELKFSVPGGSMYMRADGNVGIGTTNPQQKLDIYGGHLGIRSINENTDAVMYLGVPDINATNPGVSKAAIYFDANATSDGWSTGILHICNREALGDNDNSAGVVDARISILPNGNVGIGTTLPTRKFEVQDGRIRILYGTNGDNFFESYTQSSNSFGGRFILRWDGSANDYNVAVIMYRAAGNSLVEGRAGFFENNDDNGSFTFTGQHRSLMNKNYTSDSKGLIVSSNGKLINMDNSLNPGINESLPYCILSDIDNDKRVYGVISDKEDSNDQRGAGAGYVKTIPKANINEERIFINSLGEGAIWVSNKNGPLENGDYITSTTIPGYGGKQTAEPNTLMNYSVAKITCDCDFSLTKIVKQKLKTITVSETVKRDVYEDVTESKEKTEINFDETLNRYVQTTVTEEVTTKQIVMDSYDLYDSEGNIIGTHKVEREESYDVTKTEIDYDENGNVQYEDDLDENGNQQMVYKYETRFLKADGTQLVDEADYSARKANGEEVFIACFVGCTYHCG